MDTGIAGEGPSARRIDLVEHGPWTDVRLAPDAGRALADSGIVDARPDPYSARTGTTWQVRGLGKVGAIRLGGVEVHIAPKLPVRRLFFLLGYAADPVKHWRDDTEGVEVGAEPELLPALAAAFVRQAERALRQGLLQGYRTTDSALTVVRGRIREGDQIRRRFGVPLPVEVTYDEFTTDIAENRLLLAATTRLLRLPGVPRPVHLGLSRLRARLADVSVLPPGHRLPVWRPSRLNTRYQAALRLAGLILREFSAEQGGAGTRLDGFVLDLAAVFEDFVCASLSRALRAYGGRSVAQARHHLDEAGGILMKPDLVWYDDAGRPLGVVDAKYKAERREGFPGSDLYQMLAYCTVLGLPQGHLVYAKGNEPRQQHAVRGSGTILTQHALDLDQSPDSVVRSMSVIAAAVAGKPSRPPGMFEGTAGRTGTAIRTDR
ncbi:McrC family protein [Streptomyces sp. NPDC098789]|uniref:McrC family protein n=1 Tax=Streptomyces sp. NPDC098789 TaxID=3366098 RepID=UPI00381DE2BC